ncbi:hypothetical protein MMC25_007486 [Agyrium rufum]|nr:hypothetical protein [Agyrium rufum]
MLEWLTRDTGEDAEQDGREVPALTEPPETPAHIFAVRAFKTALFGTPAPPDHITESYKTQISRQNSEKLDRISALQAEFKPLQAQHVTKSESCAQERVDPLTSPTKGILLTPGTVASKRKSVSFHPLRQAKTASFNELLKNGGVSMTNSRLAAKEGPCILAQVQTEASQIESQSSQPPPTLVEQEFEPKRRVQAPNNTPESIETEAAHTTCDHDMTIDLQDPRSRSGRHWKREYSRYHRKSDQEMKQLIKVTQRTKSFATKRDAEAVDLDHKLERTQAHLNEMESEVSRLAAKLAQNLLGHDGKPSDGSDLVGKLARRTAEVLRYKRKIEEMEEVCHKYETDARNGTTAEKIPVRAEGQLGVLRRKAENAERKAEQLEFENIGFKKTILRVKEEMKAFEVRHKSRKERQVRADEKQRQRKNRMKEELALTQEKHASEMDHLKTQHAGEIKRLVDTINLLTTSSSGDRAVVQTEKTSTDLAKAGLSEEVAQIRRDLRRSQIENADLKSKLVLATPGGHKQYLNIISAPGAPPQDSVDIWVDEEDGTSDLRKARWTVVAEIQSPTKRPSLHGRRRYDTISSKIEPVVSTKKMDLEPLVPTNISTAALSSLAAPTTSTGYQRNLIMSSRLNSLAPTSHTGNLPPDRAAAAKMRLEQRNAARRSSPAIGKENQKP